MRIVSGEGFTMKNYIVLPTSLNQSRSLRWEDNLARMEDCMRSFKILTDKPTRKDLGRPMRKREDYNRMVLKEIDVNARNWIDKKITLPENMILF
jgi:hypothetical protein